MEMTVEFLQKEANTLRNELENTRQQHMQKEAEWNRVKYILSIYSLSINLF